MFKLDDLKEKFNNRIEFKEKRPGILQVYVPIYREDGDMYDIFIEKSQQNGLIKICDHGLNLMRLSYDYEIDTDKKEEVFHKILNQNQLIEDEGNIYIETDSENLYSAFMQYIQGVSKISSMQYFKKEVIRDMFYENLKDYIHETYEKYNVQDKYYPIEEKTEYEVDYLFDVKPYPVYVFAIKENIKAKNVAISCRQFLLENLNFKSVVVYENMESISKLDIKRVTSAVDKQFPSLQDFKDNSNPYFIKSIAA